MQRFRWTFAVGMFLAATAPVGAQVTGGVMSVTQSHMG
jgi:hypothetical protein